MFTDGLESILICNIFNKNSLTVGSVIRVWTLDDDNGRFSAGHLFELPLFFLCDTVAQLLAVKKNVKKKWN